MDVEKTVLQGQERKDEHSGSPIRTTVHLPTTLSLASRQMNRVALWASFQSGQEGLQNSLTHQVTEQLSSWLKSSSFQFVNGKIKTMTMTVYPEQLGQLSISITQNDDGLTAMLTAETKTAGHLLESGLNQLKHDLAGRGIPFVKIDIADQWQTAVPENQQSGDGQSSESFQQQNGRSNQQQQDKKKKIVSLLNNEDKTPAFPFQAWIEGGIRKG
jgi:flagellar hook-length control protein FliK